MQAPGDSVWTSTAYVYHVHRSGPLLEIENAGRAEDRGTARQQAVAAGLAAIAELDPTAY